MNIRVMKPSDYKAIYEFWLSCSGMGLNSIDDSPSGIERFLLRNPDTCFVAEENSEIIGTVMAGNDGRRGYIYHTAVSPLHRHKGIGTALVQKTLKVLSESGISKAALVVFDRNKDGNAFWEKQGFTVRNDLSYRNISLTETTRIDT